MKKKKILSTILALCMILTLVPAMSIPAHAEVTRILSKTLNPLVAGYASEDKETADYNFKYIGETHLSELRINVSGKNPASFTVTQPVTTLDSGDTAYFTVVANDNLSVGEYSVEVEIMAEEAQEETHLGYCTITQKVLATRGTQLVPKVAPIYSKFGLKNGAITGTTNAMEYKAKDSEYKECTEGSQADLAPGTYNVRYKETKSLLASDAACITIEEVAGGLRVELAPLSTPKDGEMLLTITEDTPSGGVICYGIYDTDNAPPNVGGICYTDESSKYTSATPITIEDGKYIRAFIVNKAGGFNFVVKYGVSAASNSLSRDTQKTPSNIEADPASYNTNTGEILGLTSTMEYKLSAESDAAYETCPDGRLTMRAPGTYKIRYKKNPKSFASDPITVEVMEQAGGITVTLFPLSTPKSNKMMLTITEDTGCLEGDFYYAITNEQIKNVLTGTEDEIETNMFNKTYIKYTVPVEINIQDGYYVSAFKLQTELDEDSNKIHIMYEKFGVSLAANTLPTTPVISGGGSSPDNTISGTTGDTTKPVGTVDNKTAADGKSVTTIKIDQDKIDAIIKDMKDGNTITIPTNSKSDVVSGQLTGQTVKNMEAKEAVLEIKTENTTYKLPASQINIDSISAQLGKDVALKDIAVKIRISNSSSNTAQIVADTANKNNYQVVIKPVEFEISCTSGGKTVEVVKFNGYVERMVTIPDGIDPAKITTGIVLNSDGSFRHVPTTIVNLGGKCYAKINSLTNSTYSVIWNPVKFADVVGFWAEDAINNMGSRLVVSGVGNNNYEPHRNITRAEFAAIAVRALGLTASTGASGFADVASTEWYSGYIATAVSYGLITGHDANTFSPNDNITREEAMVIVARAMKLTGLNSKADTSVLNAYTDSNAISDFAIGSVAKCVDTGVIKGETSNTVNSKANITRAEVAVVMQRLLEKSNLINK